jgi:hypothetical protein
MKRKGLGADHMVRRGDAAPGEIGEVGPLQEAPRRVVVPQGEHGECCALRHRGGECPAQVGQNGRDLGLGLARLGGPARGAVARGEPGRDLVGLGDQAVVGFLRRRPPGEVAVVDEEEALGLGMRVPYGGRCLGQREARHDVGHQGEPVPEYLARHGLGLGEAGERQEGRGMSVVHHAVGEPGVKQRLDRGVRGGAVEEVRPLDVHHLLVRQGLQRPEPVQGCQPHGRQTRGRDGIEVGAGALDVQDLHGLAEHVPRRKLDRGIPAPMHHEVRHPADQARAVDAQRQGPGLRIGPRRQLELGGLVVAPQVLEHARPSFVFV